MRLKALLIFFILSIASICHAGPTMRVVDAETNEPIEGAVVLVEWTDTKGFGLTYEESYKVIERVSDKDGNVELERVYNPFINKPDVTVYKKGYVAWNNNFIFPDYAKRTDFKWEDGYTIKLERFKDDYSYNDHISFIELCMSSTLNFENKKVFYSAFEHENKLAQKERVEKGLSP